MKPHELIERLAQDLHMTLKGVSRELGYDPTLHANLIKTDKMSLRLQNALKRRFGHITVVRNYLQLDSLLPPNADTVNLTTSGEVKELVNRLLNQVLDKENYEMIVNCSVHFDECEPGDCGYVLAKTTFYPWGADAFQVMQEFLENTVSCNYISVEVHVENIK
jgi:hypothetical protein